VPHCRTFDWNALLDKLGGDEEFVGTLLGVALQSNVSMPGDLRAACAAGNYADMARLAHKVKGTAGDLVAEGLREQARVAEMSAREGKPEALQLNLGLADALEEFLAELRTLTTPG
jgi:two-component system sensor histidine kinase/response regulator